MPLCVLTDAQIAALLENLTLDEAESFRDVLRSALHEYSTGTQSARDSDLQQPARTSITSATTGATTLFMPSCNAEGMGMKVLTLGGTGAGSGIQPGLKSGSGGSGGSGFRAAPDAGFAPDEECARPTGAISLYARSGEPLGLLHAGTLTAFRTALTSVCLLLRRDSVRNIVVFGSGSQAYWHVRLALLFRGAGVRQVHVINRRFSDSCRRILQRFYQMPAAVRQREGWADVQFSVLTPSYVEYPRLLAQQLRSADVVFCCTPATAPLFDASILTSHEGRRKGRLLVAVGSFTHAMQELPAELLRQATGGASPSSSLPSSSSPSSPTPSSPSADRTRRRHHYHKHAVEGGVVVVDTLDGALKEAGEIQAAGLTPRQLVE